MIDLELIHTCTIKRRAESISSQELQFDANSTVASNVSCLIQPNSTLPIENAMGLGQQEIFHGWFLAGSDLQNNDLVEWTDPEDAVAKTFVCRQVIRPRDNLMGAGLESHVDAMLHLREITGE